jgi:hypothetical protein
MRDTADDFSVFWDENRDQSIDYQLVGIGSHRISSSTTGTEEAICRWH